MRPPILHLSISLILIYKERKYVQSENKKNGYGVDDVLFLLPLSGCSSGFYSEEQHIQRIRERAEERYWGEGSEYTGLEVYPIIPGLIGMASDLSFVWAADKIFFPCAHNFFRKGHTHLTRLHRR